MYCKKLNLCYCHLYSSTTEERFDIVCSMKRNLIIFTVCCLFVPGCIRTCPRNIHLTKYPLLVHYTNLSLLCNTILGSLQNHTNTIVSSWRSFKNCFITLCECCKLATNLLTIQQREGIIISSNKRHLLPPLSSPRVLRSRVQQSSKSNPRHTRDARAFLITTLMS